MSKKPERGAFGFHATHQPVMTPAGVDPSAANFQTTAWRVVCAGCGLARWNRPGDLGANCGSSQDHDSAISKACKRQTLGA